MTDILKFITNIFPNLIRIIKMFNLNNKSFFINEYRKNVTVYKNGHGFIINSINMHILKPNEMNEFERYINIEDSKKGNVFPEFSDILKCKKADRFTKFGFWCSCDKTDVIHGIEEKYWSSDGSEDNRSKRNPQIIKWIINFNNNTLCKNDKINITYTMSIPNMFPINNFMFDKNICPDSFNSDMSSALRVKHYSEKLVYTIAFEKGEENERGMDFDYKPKCYRITEKPNRNMNKKPIQGKNMSDNFYERYEFTVKKPKFNDLIKINWKFKE